MNYYISESIRKSATNHFMKGALECCYARNGYQWGGESPDGADCSGVVSYGLICAGSCIRATAHDLYYRVFHIAENQLSIYDEPDTIRAIFTYYGDKDESSIVVEHCAPLVAPSIVVDADFTADMIRPKHVIDYMSQYNRNGRTSVVCNVSWDAIEKEDGYLLSGVNIYTYSPVIHEIILRPITDVRDYARQSRKIVTLDAESIEDKERM